MTGVGRIESVRGVAHPEYGGEGCLGDNSWSTGCTGGLATWTRGFFPGAGHRKGHGKSGPLYN